jgi:5-(carboxyamino)imidazole ribonucleotide mutase
MERGLRVVISGAGGAAQPPGMVASHTVLPVMGVPVESGAPHGMDSLLTIVRMPAGIPVTTVAIENARSASLVAVQILAAVVFSLREKSIGVPRTQRR